MLRNFRRFVLALALAAAPLILVPTQAHAQWGYGQNNDTQRAYQAGYNNGVNDANRGKGMNLSTGNWKGINLQAYQRGYESGYRSQGRNNGGYNNGGYNNGGYYGGGRNRDHDWDRDRDRGQGTYSYGGYGQNGYGQNNDTQRAYQAGYNNGVNDRNRGKSQNLSTGNWRGINLQAYQRGYEEGYRSAGGRGGYRR